jgi:hypothetical protein
MKSNGKWKFRYTLRSYDMMIYLNFLNQDQIKNLIYSYYIDKPASGFHLHATESKGTIALNAKHSLCWLKIATIESSCNGKSGSQTHSTKRTRIESMSG